jgi:hypothetical protein
MFISTMSSIANSPPSFSRPTNSLRQSTRVRPASVL